MAELKWLFEIYALNEDYSKGQKLGGAPTLESAATLLSAVYQAVQTLWPAAQHLIGIWDDTDTLVAFVGPPSEPDAA